MLKGLTSSVFSVATILFLLKRTLNGTMSLSKGIASIHPTMD